MKDMKNKYIIFDAEPFCYGPIATTISIVEYFRKNIKELENYDFVLLSTGTSIQLAQKGSHFDHIIECATAKQEEIYKHNDLINNASLYISNTNPQSIINIKSNNVRKMYIDLLFWMWDRPKILPDDVDSFLAQFFFGIEEQMKRLNLDDITVINPIIPPYMDDLRDTAIDQELVLISLGGLDSIYFETDASFHKKVLDIILSMPLMASKKIKVAGGGKTIYEIRNNFQNQYPNVQFDSFERKDFCRLISQSHHFICNSGILTYYDGIALGKRMFFLPPHNYSSYQQFNLIKEVDDQIAGFTYSDIFSDNHNISNYLAEDEGIQRVKDCMKNFVKDEKFQNAFKEKLEDFLNSSSLYNLDKMPVQIFPNGSGKIASEVLQLI